jgi:hypothetical protein
MATKKGATVVQIGQARSTDVSMEIKVTKKLAKMLQALSEEEVVTIPTAEFKRLMEGGDIAEGVLLPSTIEEKVEGPAEELNVLDKAREIIYGDREEAYGNPRFNLDTIAQFWNVYMHRLFHSWGIDGAEFKAEDVAQMMILLKTARLIHNPTHFDSLVDQAGYAALQQRIQNL